MSNTRHTNRLAGETSPYLLQHAHNPVDWFPWGPEALERAKKEKRPILLSIGYSACHWCHVMERESFESEAIAELMNQNFVCIKVDREERPDLDDIYMIATMQMSGHGGWPMTVFLTPEQKPFFAGTYFPPEDGLGRPGFPSLLNQLAGLWKDKRPELEAQAERLTQRLRRQSQAAKVAGGLESELIELAAEDLAERYDSEWGGFSGAPKFPAAASLSLLLRHAQKGEERCLQMVRHTLDCMAAGGMYDQIAGGFSRYSTDERWLVPHFEKMLYDNALLTRAYLEGYQATHDPYYARIASETMDYILLEMTSPEGGFYSSTDADSEGVEGKFFVWTPEQIEAVLGPEKAKQFCAFYDIQPGGNWEGHSIPNTPHARDFTPELAQLRALVYQERKKRIAPGLDDKILTSWNGMMIAALAEGSRVLGEERYLQAARRAADFLWSTLRQKDGRLLRTCRQGKAHLSAYLEDYAWLGQGLLDLYEAGADETYLHRAHELAQRILKDFADAEIGAFYETAHDHEALIVRHRQGSDGATPSANAVAAHLLVRLSYHFGLPEWRRKAMAAVAAYAQEVRRVPSAFCQSLAAAELAGEGAWEVVFSGDVEEFKRGLARHFLPNRVIGWCRGESQLPLLQGKVPAGVYLCRGTTCAAPAHNLQELEAALQQLSQAPGTGPRLEGRATPEATAALAQAHPQGYVELGRTGLKVSRLGFGGYRVDDVTEDHEEALRAALERGINLIDTSTNYTDGDSERLVGVVLRDFERASRVVVSKLGYVQGQNLELVMRRRRHGRPFPEMVEYGTGCWHCMHPEYLADQLERSLARLNLQTLDVCLLHNPEYYLSDAIHRPTRPIDELRGEFYRRLEAAFGYLEEQVKAGRIGCYGVSSNSCVDSQDDPESTSLKEILAAARRAGGEQHHFRVLQLPLNLIESQGVLGSDLLELARKEQIAVLANRPLNAFKGPRMARLANFEVDEDDPELEDNLEGLSQLETEYRTTFGPYVQGPGSEELFRWSEMLSSLPENLQSLEHWTQIEGTRIRPQLLEMVNALNQAMGGPLVDRWVDWRDRYMAQFRDLMNDLEETALRKSQEVAEAVAEQIDPHLTDHLDQSLSRKALWVVASTPGITCVLNGMRTPEYVEDSCEVLSWAPLANPRPVYEALRDW